MEILNDLRTSRFTPFKEIAQKVIDTNQSEELVNCTKDKKLKTNALWLLTHVVKLNPEPVFPFQEKFIDLLLAPQNFTDQRNTSVILIHLPYTSYREGEVIDLAFAHITSQEVPVAVRVNMIYLSLIYTAKYPELMQELIQMKEILLPGAQPSLQAAFRKVKA